MRSTQRSLTTWIFSLLCACGSDPSSEQQAHAPLPSLELLSGNIVDALCESQLQCPIAYDDQLYTAALFVQRHGEPLDNCRAYHKTTKTLEQHERYRQAQLRGSLEVDPAGLRRLAQCELPSEDQSWLVGKLRPGEACQLHAECQDGYCDTAAVCPGTCVARRPDGVRCDSPWQCLSNNCDVTCLPRALAIGANEGEACSSEGEVVTLCAPTLWCDERSGKCRHRLQPGKPVKTTMTSARLATFAWP